MAGAINRATNEEIKARSGDIGQIFAGREHCGFQQKAGERWMSERETVDVTEQELATALDAVLTELVEYRLSRPRSTDLILLAPAPQTALQKRAALFSRIARDPFEGSLLFTLRGIGEALFSLGGTKLMRDVLQEVAARDPENECQRLSPADSQWDGIGNPDDLWIS